MLKLNFGFIFVHLILKDGEIEIMEKNIRE